MQPAVEEVPDEETSGTQKKKKKKKPKKKKKKTAAAAAEAEDDEEEEEESKEAEDEQMQSALADLSLGAKTPTEQTTNSPTKPKPAASNSTAQSSSIYGMGGAALPSSISLVSTTAQSARSYLKEENLLDEKVKVKSRPEPAAAPSPAKKLWGNKEKNKEQSKDEHEQKSGKDNVFQRLISGAKTSTRNCFERMFGDKKSGSLKWDDFVKANESLWSV